MEWQDPRSWADEPLRRALDAILYGRAADESRERLHAYWQGVARRGQTGSA